MFHYTGVLLLLTLNLGVLEQEACEQRLRSTFAIFSMLPAVCRRRDALDVEARFVQELCEQGFIIADVYGGNEIPSAAEEERVPERRGVGLNCAHLLEV